jgi:imidazolonepropionase-like amidohydrolase
MRGLFTGSKTLYIHCDYVKEMISAIGLADKFGIRLVIVGGGDSYRITDLLKSKNVAIILGRTHSLPPREDDEIDLQYKLPSILSKAGINYTISMDGSWQGRNLAFNAGTSAAYGLTKEEALMSITLNAARILGIDATVGSLESGKDATLVISSGDILDMKTNHVESAFINGREISIDNFQKQLNQTYQSKYGIKKQ